MRGRTSPSASRSPRRRPSSPSSRPTRTTATSPPTGRAPAAVPEQPDRRARRQPRQLTAVVVKLNPDRAWGTRTQTIQVLGREQSASASPRWSAAGVHLQPGHRQHRDHPGQRHRGRRPAAASPPTPAPRRPGRRVPGDRRRRRRTRTSPSPACRLARPRRSRPTRSRFGDGRNIGTAASAATTVNFYLGTTQVGTGRRSARSPPAPSATVIANIGTRDAGTYPLSAKVDEANTVIEQNEANNTYTNPTNLVVGPGRQLRPGRLRGQLVAEQPVRGQHGHLLGGHPEPGHHRLGRRRPRHHADRAQRQRHRGHDADRLVSAAPSPPARPRRRSTWAPGPRPTAVHGRVVARRRRQRAAGQAGQQHQRHGRSSSAAARTCPTTCTRPRTARSVAARRVVGPNRTIGDLAGEASGRRAVTLNSTGSYVQWTTRASTNTLVTRFSIPDTAGGTGPARR